MSADAAVRRIVIGIDGSEHAAEALEWTIAFARAVEPEIIAVFAIPPPTYVEYGGGYAAPIVPPELDPQWRAEITREFEQDWCRSLRESGLRYRLLVEDGRAASVIAAVAEREDADLVVVGRRGRGGIVELVLGSVSHELSHHSTRPVLLISGGRHQRRKQAAATPESAQ